MSHTPYHVRFELSIGEERFWFDGHNKVRKSESLGGDKSISFWRSKILYFDLLTLALSNVVFRNFLAHEYDSYIS